MSVDEVLREAEAYMRGRKRGSWQMYDYFKPRVGWIDCKEYDEFIRKLTKILKV